MVGLLLICGADRDLAPKSCFSLVKMIALSNEKRCFEIDDFAILSPRVRTVPKVSVPKRASDSKSIVREMSGWRHFGRPASLGFGVLINIKFCRRNIANIGQNRPDVRELVP